MHHIVISPIFTKFFSGRIWMGLDYERIKAELEKKYGFQARIIPFTELKEQLITIPENATLFYSSVYNRHYLRYIQDTVLYISLKRPDLVLLPNQNQLNCLENKGFQELYKDILQIEKVRGNYYGDIDDALADKDIAYPFVLKTLNGALSSGVQLISNRKELEGYRTKVKKRSFKEKIAFRLNRSNSFKRDANLCPVSHLLTANFNDVFAKRIPVVVQDFVPGLECDYKVLLYGNKYFVVRRQTRENDFRASGSGRLEWVEPPLAVLNFAKELKAKFRVPFISLDIGVDIHDACYLFEFQGTAFGPATLTAGNRFYYFDEEWKSQTASFNLEEEYAYAINHFVNENR